MAERRRSGRGDYDAQLKLYQEALDKESERKRRTVLSLVSQVQKLGTFLEFLFNVRNAKLQPARLEIKHDELALPYINGIFPYFTFFGAFIFDAQRKTHRLDTGCVFHNKDRKEFIFQEIHVTYDQARLPASSATFDEKIEWLKKNGR